MGVAKLLDRIVGFDYLFDAMAIEGKTELFF